jgi:hypothetical protein
VSALRRYATFSRKLALPFIATAAIGPFMRALCSVKKQFGKIEKTVCVLLVARRRILTDGFQSASLWLIETFPQFGQAG